MNTFVNIITKNFTKILDTLPVGVFLTDPSGATLYINKMYEQVTGIKKEEILGTNVRTLIEKGIFDKVLNLILLQVEKLVQTSNH